MVLEAASMAPMGASRSRLWKLVEVCRPRDVPIIIFVNRLDREGRDLFDLLDEIEQWLALDVTPASWLSGWGATFSAPMICSPTSCYCSSVASTTGSQSPCAAIASTTRNFRFSCRKPHSPMREELEMAKECPGQHE